MRFTAFMCNWYWALERLVTYTWRSNSIHHIKRLLALMVSIIFWRSLCVKSIIYYWTDTTPHNVIGQFTISLSMSVFHGVKTLHSWYTELVNSFKSSLKMYITIFLSMILSARIESSTNTWIQDYNSFLKPQVSKVMFLDLRMNHAPDVFCVMINK